MNKKLTQKQAAFVREYAVDKNATRAAAASGYSPRTAESQGSRLLKNVKVQSAIDAAIAKQAERTEITADRVLKEYAKIAFANAQSYHDADGGVKQITDLSNDDAAAIQVFEQSESGTKIKLYDKVKSLDSLAKHLGLLQPDSGEIGKVPELKIFLRADDGKIHEMRNDGRLRDDVPTEGLCINVVDGRKPED